MNENPMNEDPTNEDLLTRIQRETHERLRELRGAVDEHERLTAELSTLQDITEPSLRPEPPADLGPPADPELSVAPELSIVPEPHVVSKPPVTLGIASEPPVTSELPAVTEPPVDLKPPAVTEPPKNVVRLPARRSPARTRMVSPKVARLMRAPRRPALERSGVVRVGAVHGGSSPVDLWPHEEAEEIDVEAEVYERSI